MESPISRIDVGYSLDDNLIFTIVLNTKENTQNLQNSTPINFKASIKGLINWGENIQDPKKKILVANFQQASSNSPFTYISDAKDGTTALVPSPAKRKWKSIEQAKLTFEIDGKFFELPYLTIYPPSIESSEKKSEVIISTQAKMLGKNIGEINVRSSDGSAFEITSLEIEKQSPAGTTKHEIIGNNLGNSRFANSGTIDLLINTPFEIDNNATYIAKVNAKKIGSSEIIPSNSNNIVFIDAIPLYIIGKSPNYSISIDDKDVIFDEVRTGGKGELGIRFATKEFSDKIRISRESLGGGTFKFTYEGLNELPDNSFSYFYYTRDGIDLPQPYLITKKSPVVSDFKFNGTKEENILIEFRLPQYVNKELISINIIGKDDNLEVKGTTILKPDQTDQSKFQAILSNDLTELVSKDTLIDVNIIIKYNNLPLYSLGLAIFNQKLLNQKMGELIAETANKPSKRDPEKIKSIVEDIVEIGKAVGNSIDDEEMKSTIETLSGDNKEKIQNTMSDIGKWALISGKIVLPLLL